MSKEDERTPMPVDVYTMLFNQQGEVFFSGPVPENAKSGPKFSCGTPVFSPGVLRDVFVGDAMSAHFWHSRGIWRETPDKLAKRNDLAVEQGGPILSLHETAEGTRFVIYTQADRSVSNFMLLEEYKLLRADRLPQPLGGSNKTHDVVRRLHQERQNQYVGLGKSQSAKQGKGRGRGDNE